MQEPLEVHEMNYLHPTYWVIRTKATLDNATHHYIGYVPAYGVMASPLRNIGSDEHPPRLFASQMKAGTFLRKWLRYEGNLRSEGGPYVLEDFEILPVTIGIKELVDP